MDVIKSNMVVCFDVDDTLVSYEKETKFIINGEFSVGVTPIDENIQALKRHKAWGHYVVVWSRSGHQWAKAVVKTLNLEKYVDVCQAKPVFYYDDMSSEKWMGKPRWGGDRR